MATVRIGDLRNVASEIDERLVALRRSGNVTIRDVLDAAARPASRPTGEIIPEHASVEDGRNRRWVPLPGAGGGSGRDEDGSRRVAIPL